MHNGDVLVCYNYENLATYKIFIVLDWVADIYVVELRYLLVNIPQLSV